MIIGRKKELGILDKLLQSESAEFLAVYGRRRVGKTYLLYEHLKSHIVFSFAGSFEQKRGIQLDNFFREYLRSTKGQMETQKPTDWSTAFSYLTDYLYRIQEQSARKLVVFIDEMPWLDTPKSGFVPALEYFWNQHASKMNKVVLVTCGSTASWMKKKLLKSKGGLYNRVTCRINLQPFSLHETELFCKSRKLNFSRYQIVQLYMVMGGIPFYLNELYRGKSVTQLIDEICFQPTGLLSDEYEQLYHSLFKNAENHVAIVEALAKHPYGLVRKALVEKAKVPDGGSFTRSLHELLDSGFITKYLPFQKKQKESIYRLIDLYSLFYIRFIRENVSNYPNTWQQLSSESRFISWSGYAFENICFLHTPQILWKLGLSGTPTEISSWYHKGNEEFPGSQVDMLIDRKDGFINLCEAKFTNKEFILTKAYAAQLRRKRSVFEHVTGTKKSVVTTLLSTYPAIQNSYYAEEIFSEVSLDELFHEINT